jgi:hypothetical protein
MGGYWNRAARRSGGARPRYLPGQASKTRQDLRSIQCFEERHHDCNGTCAPLLPLKCKCPCHKKEDRP